MASVNKVILVGNLGADPDQRFLQNGDAVCSINVATSESWKDKQTGDKKEATEWHRVVFFARQAEVAGEFLRKGSKIYVEGRLQTRKWQNKDGVDQYTTEVVAHEMQMLDSRSPSTTDNGQKQTSGQRQQQPRQQAPQQQRQSAPAFAGDFDDEEDDDQIPF